jgi:Glycosyltransferase
VKLIIDARALRMYPVGKADSVNGFTGGSEVMVREIAHRLANKHMVHVVTPDLETEQPRSPYEWWWPPNNHPKRADAVIMVHSLEFVEDYQADFMILATNGVDPDLGPKHTYASAVDAFPVFSNKHAELMCQFRPTIDKDRIFVTGLGVDLEPYSREPVPTRVPGRLFWSNDPARGLWHMLDIFDALKKTVPQATLHIGYDFERQFEHHRWIANALAEELWECKRRIACTEGVESLGALTRPEMVRQQRECEVHVMASDPPNIGSQIHGITQMECAAAGAALVLSDTEAFREVFGTAARILPLPGTFLTEHERRFDAQDWAENVSSLLGDQEALEGASTAARQLACRNTWDDVAEKWEAMLGMLGE